MTTMLPWSLREEGRDLRVPRYVLAGAAIGFLLALAITFAMALLDGTARGMTAGSCVLYGCTITMLLSQPIGVSGMLAGAALGGAAGAILGGRGRGTR